MLEKDCLNHFKPRVKSSTLVSGSLLPSSLLLSGTFYNLGFPRMCPPFCYHYVNIPVDLQIIKKAIVELVYHKLQCYLCINNEHDC